LSPAIFNQSYDFNTGDGNDTIEGNGGIRGIYNEGSINTGKGKDIIIANLKFPDTGLSGLSNRPSNRPFSPIPIIDTGEDDDIITTYSGIFNSGIINTGNGDDSIISDSGEPFNPGIDNYSNGVETGVIETGEGNDTIEANSIFVGISNQGSINTGKGKDIIIANGGNSGLSNISTIDTGDDDDIITSTVFSAVSYNEDGINSAISNDGTINTGNGQDSIISQGNFLNRGGVFLGDGNDSILADKGFFNRAIQNFNFIGTGDGNDTITSSDLIYNEGVIETGNGDDSIIVDEGIDDITGTTYGIYNNGGAINMGDGNDSIIANQGFESGENSSGAWFLGEGDDYIKGFGSGDFYGGNGNDTLELTPGTYTVGIWGEGGESPIFTKGNQLMITSEFEKLKAGNTLYDFTSLTAGQIITVA
jgi:hypothetical protein